MLTLKPSCEHCDRDLPPDSLDARICTFECTFCRECVDTLLSGVCPNCGGTPMPRPIRHVALLALNPASSDRVHKPVDLVAHKERLSSIVRSGELEGGE